MSTEPKRELHLFFATENTTSVILRRGARKLWQLIRWDRANDVFEAGQWIKRRVLPESCTISPDGRHFLYSVYDGRNPAGLGDVYTAISRPPYFTALALFPDHYVWSRIGGRFLDNRHYFLATPTPNTFAPISELTQVTQGKVTKHCRTGLRTLDGKAVPLSRELRAELLDGRAPADPHIADRYDTQEGRLYRRNGMDLELIADFGPPVFEAVVAPYAPSQPTGTGQTRWHPLDREAP